LAGFRSFFLLCWGSVSQSILAGYVTGFKARRQTPPDWLPLILAGVVLGELLQFWWAIAELTTIKSWSLPAFTFLVGFIMLLFLAAALIVPAESDRTPPRELFERDGRWALAVLACYHLAAIVGNWRLFGEALVSLDQYLLLAQAAFAMAIALIAKPRLQEILTVCYVA
jgi:hypothetical protein